MSTDKIVDTDRITKLSHQQMLMWTGQQLEPTAPIYNTAFLIEIPRAINVVGFKQSFDTVVRHSKSLRTTIELIQGVPHLKLNDEIDYEFQEFDFSDSSTPDERCQGLV